MKLPKPLLERIDRPICPSTGPTTKNPAFAGGVDLPNRDGGADGARTRDLQRDRLAL
jgi:hypothetical protein